MLMKKSQYVSTTSLIDLKGKDVIFNVTGGVLKLSRRRLVKDATV